MVPLFKPTSTSSLPTIAQQVEIQGNDVTINGSDREQILAIDNSDTGNDQVILADLTFLNGAAIGGNGTAGGGGGLGAGGALFINLEGSQANILRLTNLILLIALAYTSACFKGKSFKNQGHQKYITRLTEAPRKSRRLA